GGTPRRLLRLRRGRGAHRRGPHPPPAARPRRAGPSPSTL
ncbi:MAG: hypothetical protein AVDCRST_MAG73-2041, partial [uncultured Thermomicrobiales bacterium]